MKDYLRQSNLARAMVLASIVTLMAVPRILHAGLDTWIYVPAALFAMTIVAGAGSAWGDRAGMYGLFPEKRRMLAGIGAAVLAGCAIIPLQLMWIDPVLIDAVRTASDKDSLRLSFPSSTPGRVALLLWVAGFETMFFQAGSMSFFARLSGNQWLSIAATVVFRVYATNEHLLHCGIEDTYYILLASSALGTVIACALFARAGLPAAMAFTSVLSLHHFFYPAV